MHNTTEIDQKSMWNPKKNGKKIVFSSKLVLKF